MANDTNKSNTSGNDADRTKATPITPSGGSGRSGDGSDTGLGSVSSSGHTSGTATASRPASGTSTSGTSSHGFGGTRAERSYERDSGNTSGGTSNPGEGGTRHELRETAEHHARDIGERLRSRGVQLADKQKSCVCNYMSSYEHALRKGVDTLREEEHGTSAARAEFVADRVKSVHDYIERRDVESLANDAGGVVRKHPLLVLGGLALAGVALGRFLSATPPKPAYGDDSDYGDDNDYAGGYASGGGSGGISSSPSAGASPGSAVTGGYGSGGTGMSGSGTTGFAPPEHRGAGLGREENA